MYTVVIDADQPVVAGVRVSTAEDPSTQTVTSDTTAPPSDFAWFGPSPVLNGDTAVAIAPGPAPMLSVVNPTKASVTLALEPRSGGASLSLIIPAGGSASIAVQPDTVYLLRNAKGLVAAVSYAGAAQLADYAVSSAGPVSGPIVIRP
jgi:hypothetical protein